MAASIALKTKREDFVSLTFCGLINSLRPRQNKRHFADDVFKCNFLNETVWIPIKISLKFVPEGPINNISALVQIMAWRRAGDKQLSEPMMTQFNDTYMRHSASMSFNNIWSRKKYCLIRNWLIYKMPLSASEDRYNYVYISRRIIFVSSPAWKCLVRWGNQCMIVYFRIAWDYKSSVIWRVIANPNNKVNPGVR